MTRRVSPLAQNHRLHWLRLVASLLLLVVGLFAAFPADAIAGDFRLVKNLSYKSGDNLNEYEKERCKLDLYLPTGHNGFPTLVWFHGGALLGGSKDDEFNARIGQALAKAGVAVAMVNYRLSPKAKYPAYIQDAATAFAWVRQHISEYSGTPQQIFVGGHSAGGYLTFMIGLDPRYLGACGLNTKDLAGLIPISGQTMTHYTIREERGLDKDIILADEAAPIHYTRKGAPPMLVLFADHDMPARAEENQYLVAALKASGNTNVAQQLIRERDHGSIAGNIPQPDDPAGKAILDFIQSSSRKDRP